MQDLKPIDTIAPVNEHALALGKLVSNLQSLEFALRAFLVNDEIRAGSSFPQSANLNNMDIDDVVPLNAFTNYDTLGKLIRRYNSNRTISSADLRIDETLADIRDAVAHGRVSASAPSGHLQLLKFSKPRGNEKHVKVTFSAAMTKEWFGVQIRRARNALLTVNEANDKLQNGTL